MNNWFLITRTKTQHYGVWTQKQTHPHWTQ